jgi:gamma-glutamyltranspeptidase / glutathione hydrolase
MARDFTIAAGHPLTAEAARHALECGGNAFDAALAGWLASCLAEPVLTSPGGGGFAMVAPAGGPVRLYDFFTQTPLQRAPGATAYPLEADFGSTRQVFHLGPGSIATPGCVAGILRMQADLGRLPVAECAAPARDLCRSGLTITTHAAQLLSVVQALYTATPEACALFGSASTPGACLGAGESFHNPEFGAVLDMLVAEGARWFYHGDIARMVESACQSGGGHLRREDFLRYQVAVREPLEIHRNGATVWLNPPPAMGGALIAAGLSLREPTASRPYPFSAREDWLGWIEPLRIMSCMRTRSGIGDLQPAEKDALRDAFRRCPALETALEQLLPDALPHLRARGTTQISIIDGQGNEVAMTTSNGSGSAVMLPGTGFMLNNMLGEEDLQPEGLETWRPDVRLASMMAPTLARLPDGTRVVTGSGGSNRIRSVLLQILRHLIDRGADLEQAVLAARLHWEDDTLHAETEAASMLGALPQPLPWPVIGHSLPNLFFGGAHSAARLPDGRLQAVGDPRRGGVVRARR